MALEGDDDQLGARYHVAFGAAFARARLELGPRVPDEVAFREGRARGLAMHKFKRGEPGRLPRVRRVLSMLAGLAPASLLDVGSGRGVFLWPLLEVFPEMPVVAIDRSAQRAADLAALARGGVPRLTAHEMDVTRLSFADGTFDGVTILEVLEHLHDPARAAREVMRVAQRFVVASVPSHADDNPEHIHLFDRAALVRLFDDAGARSVRVDHVLNHAVVLALK